MSDIPEDFDNQPSTLPSFEFGSFISIYTLTMFLSERQIYSDLNLNLNLNSQNTGER